MKYVVIVGTLVLVMGVLTALGPYLYAFGRWPYPSDYARKELAVETRGRFAHRFVVGMGIGAGVSAIVILPDLGKRRRPKADGRTTETRSSGRRDGES